jgi:hypothetical protein
VRAQLNYLLSLATERPNVFLFGHTASICDLHRQPWEGSHAMAVTQPVRVVYIAGYGRSGTTVLDIAFGQHAAVLGAGEITALTRHVWRENEFCACGKPVHDCDFWSSVLAEWSKGQEPSLMSEYGLAQQKIEGSAWLARTLLRLGVGRHFKSYSLHTTRLFQELLSRSGKDIVIDSSKLPARAMALAHIPNIDLRIIHLVRDGRGVAWSLLKGYDRDPRSGLQKKIRPKSVFRTALRWTIVNLATEYLSRKLGPQRVLRLRYEDFTSDPAAVMRRIGTFVALDLGQIGRKLQRGDPIGPGHQIAGNRLRMNASLSLVKDESWRSLMPAGQQAFFRRLCGWMLRRYGYL